MRVQITECLDIDLATEMWICNRCEHRLFSAHGCYKEGCAVRERDPHDIHFPRGPNKDFNFSFDPEWMRIIEYYCPQCAVMIENEYLPPGHPLTWDIQLDLDQLKAKHGFGGTSADPAASRNESGTHE